MYNRNVPVTFITAEQKYVKLILLNYVKQKCISTAGYILPFSSQNSGFMLCTLQNNVYDHQLACIVKMACKNKPQSHDILPH